jgi:hypothetical protein
VKGDVVARYAKLKRDLAARSSNDRLSSTLGKADFIQAELAVRRTEYVCRGRGAGSPPPALADELPLVRDVVDQDVFPEPVGRGDEDASAVDPHQVVDELHHVR